MKSDKLVVNASPIISLAKIGCADFLPELFAQFIIPEGVFEEITSHKYHDPAIEWLKAQNDQTIIKSIGVMDSEYLMISSRLPCGSLEKLIR